MKPVKSIGKRELTHRFLAFLFFVSVVQVFKHFAFRVGDGPEQTIHRDGQAWVQAFGIVRFRYARQTINN